MNITFTRIDEPEWCGVYRYTTTVNGILFYVRRTDKVWIHDPITAWVAEVILPTGECIELDDIKPTLSEAKESIQWSVKHGMTRFGVQLWE